MITVEALLLRRRILAGSARRHRPRARPRPQLPTGAVLAYTRELVAWSRALDDAILRAVHAETGVRLDDTRPPPPMPLLSSQLARVQRSIQAALARAVSRESLVSAIDRIAARVNDFSRDQWRRQLNAALGIDPGDLDVSSFVAEFRRQNLSLLTALAHDKVQRVQAVLQTSGSSARVETLATEIRAATGATASHAALIARDQVLKFNSQVTQARHVAAGITQYRWSSSRDARVRPAHRALDGQTFAYDAPPITDPRTGRRSNPGQDYQCRCLALALLPGLA